MISRLWRGWTANDEDADAYEALLKTQILPELHGIEGHRGARVLRRDVEGGVEFVVMNLFDSMDAVRVFAGENPDAANISPEAGKLLSAFDERANHYEAVIWPDDREERL